MEIHSVFHKTRFSHLIVHISDPFKSKKSSSAKVLHVFFFLRAFLECGVNIGAAKTDASLQSIFTFNQERTARGGTTVQ